MTCSTVLSDLVHKYLALFQYDTAKFFAERLYYENPSPENLNMMAQCFFRLGKFKQTYHILQDSDHPSNRYLFALVCVAIGKLSEAERALSPNTQIHPQNLTQKQLNDIPEGAAGLYLLGKIARRGQCREAALFYFKKAIELDPSCWSALREYNEMGGSIDVADVFGMELTTAIAACGGQPLAANDCGGQGEGIAIRNLEKQKMAETLGMGAHHGHPAQCTAISLGKSSSTLHIPFPHASSPQATFDHESNAASRDLDQGIMTETVDLMSPGLTPIGNQRPSLLLRGGHSAFPLTGDSMGGRYTPQSNSAMGNLANHSDYFAFSRGDMDDKGDPYDSSRVGRRVSFGPPSRLSFSSYGVDDEGEADRDEHPPSKYPRHGQSRPSRGEDDSARAASGGMLGSLGSPAPRPGRNVPMSATRGRQSSSPSAPVTRGRASQLPTPTSPTRGGVSSRKQPVHNSPMGSKKPLPLSPPVRRGSGSRSPPRQMSPPASRRTTVDSTKKTVVKAKTKEGADVNSENEKPQNQSQSAGPGDTAQKKAVDHYAAEKHRAKALVALFVAAQQLLSQYQCQDALDVLRLLPEKHRGSGLVNQMIGSAYFEMGDYRACLLAMREMLRLEPYRIQGTEIMSTALWHTKSKQELCALGQQVVDIDKFAPETWCVVGNCFSLQQEHDTAIRFFERSIQVDQWFAYAHTLCGHEHVFNENFDKAMVSFRSALKIDNRHYNAWYGMGSIFYRQERLELAEYHFRKAADINKRSAVLQCYLGIVLHAQNRPMKTIEARQILQAACAMDPKNPQIHFQLAHILMSCAVEADDLHEVESRLLTVRDLAPREPPVFVMLGQVCQRLGKTVEALGHFNTAMDLDPKQSSSLKLLVDEIGGQGSEEDMVIDLDDEL